MATTITVLALLLLNGALRASAGEGGSLLDVYSSRQAPVRQPGTVTIQSVGVSPVACMDAGACLAQCSTDPLLNQDPAAVQAQVRRRSLQRSQADGARALTPGGGRAARQLVQCTNNMRLAPGLFQQDISAVCSYDDVQAAAAGLGALQGSAALSGVAQAHSDEEAAQNYFSHFSSNGSSPYDRRALGPARRGLCQRALSSRLADRALCLGAAAVVRAPHCGRCCSATWPNPRS